MGQQVSIDCTVEPTTVAVKFNRATKTFHQVADSNKVYGLNFPSAEEAKRFEDAVKSAVLAPSLSGRFVRQLIPSLCRVDSTSFAAIIA